MSRILIVEDDEKIAALEQDYLEMNGYETKILGNGSQVIPELEKEHYDLLLLDVMLPGCSGYDICRKIRDEIDIPILMVTARSEGPDIIRGLGLGADDYITKPFDPFQLVARVRSHLKQYERLTRKQEKVDDGAEKIVIQNLVIEPGTWKVWNCVCQTGSLSFYVSWQSIPILFFQKRSCLKPCGGMILCRMQPLFLYISTA